MKSKPPVPLSNNIPLGRDENEIARVNLNVPLALRKRWKTAAAQAGRPMADLIVEAMDKYLDTQNKEGNNAIN